MKPPKTTLTLRRSELARALKLSATDLRVLMAVLVGACSSSGRTWSQPERIAEALHLSESLVRDSLDQLAMHDLLELQSGVLPRLPSIELGPLLVRDHEPPPNLPIETKRRV